MSLKDQILTDLKRSMKEGNRDRVSALRMVRSKILEKEVESRSGKGRDYELTDEETLDVLTSYAKQRRQSIDSYLEAGREDLAAKEQDELKVIEGYLPRQLTEDEIRNLVQQVITETEASAPADMGQVMREVMPRVKGAADGKKVSQIVRQELQKNS